MVREHGFGSGRDEVQVVNAQSARDASRSQGDSIRRNPAKRSDPSALEELRGETDIPSI